MSALILIRHGQASFGTADYDVLSELGRQQSQATGTLLASMRIDAVYTGPLKRQLDTASEMAAAAPTLPEATVLDGLAEYPAFKLFEQWLPVLRESDPQVKMLVDKAKQGGRIDDLYVLISQKWARGELRADGLENFTDFSTRVNDAFDKIMKEQGRGRRIAVVTSGGPVAIAMARALGLDPSVALKTAWVLANASLSEFRYRDNEFTLVGFNRIPHVNTDELLTYR